MKPEHCKCHVDYRDCVRHQQRNETIDNFNAYIKELSKDTIDTSNWRVAEHADGFSICDGSNPITPPRFLDKKTAEFILAKCTTDRSDEREALSERELSILATNYLEKTPSGHMFVNVEKFIKAICSTFRAEGRLERLDEREAMLYIDQKLTLDDRDVTIINAICQRFGVTKVPTVEEMAIALFNHDAARGEVVLSWDNLKEKFKEMYTNRAIAIRDLIRGK